MSPSWQVASERSGAEKVDDPDEFVPGSSIPATSTNVAHRLRSTEPADPGHAPPERRVNHTFPLTRAAPTRNLNSSVIYRLGTLTSGLLVAR